MPPKTRQLIVRANRFLGSALLDKDLITEGQLEQANDRLLEKMEQGLVERPVLLEILIREMGVLVEQDLIEVMAKGAPVGLVDLRRIQVTLPGDVNLEECLATSTVPFDQMEDQTCLATTHYLSVPVRDYWEFRLGKRHLWYVTTLESFEACIESLGGGEAQTAVPSGGTGNPSSTTNDN